MSESSTCSADSMFAIVTNTSAGIAEARHDLGAICQALCRGVTASIGDACSIALASDDAAKLDLIAAHHQDPEAAALIHSVHASHPPEIGTGIAGSVAQSREARLIPFVSLEEVPASWRSEIAAYAATFPIYSMAVLPLESNGRLLGTIEVTRHRPDRPYGELELSLLRELATRAALAIENARLYHENRAAAARSEAAAAARRDLLEIISRDLRNPLNALLGAGLLLQIIATEKGGTHLKRPIDVIMRAGDRMNRLLHDLLDFVLIESGRLPVEWKDENVLELLESSLQAVGPVIERKSLVLKRSELHEALRIECDRDRVLQILSSLLNSAIAFTPPGRTISVSAAPYGEDGGEVRFEVADSGRGLSEDELSELFDHLSSERHDRRSSFGLGLAIAKGLVEAHGGKLWVESKGDEGNRFFFTLPRAEAPASMDTLPPNTRLAAPKRAAASILVVDDDSDIRAAVAQILEDEGYTVATAANGLEALRILQEGLAPKMILLDLSMPTMDGYEFRMKQRHEPELADIPTYVISANPKLKEKAEALKVEGILSKPINFHELLALAASCCGAPPG